MRTFLISVAVLVLMPPAPAVGQPLSVSASAAVMWLDLAPGSGGARPLDEPSASLGSIYHPAVVVVWRGEPGWAFRERRSANEVFFSGADDFFRSGERVASISMEAGGVRLEIAHDSTTGEVLVNGAPVRLPDGHNVVLVDDADAGGPPSDVQTLRVDGEDGESIEAFLGRSEAVTKFVRCGVPLPEGAFEGDGRARRSIQRMLDERCVLLTGR